MQRWRERSVEKVSTDEEGVEGKVIECPNCLGSGSVDREDGFTSEDDYMADKVDDNYSDGNGY